jgi:hypothetical protein
MSYEINIKQGATFRLMLTITDSNSQPIDLTSHVFRGQIRRLPQDTATEAVFSFVIADQVTNTGEVMAEISAADTAAINCVDSTRPERRITTFCYDIESDDGSGIVNRWLEGVANISPEVTK